MSDLSNLQERLEEYRRLRVPDAVVKALRQGAGLIGASAVTQWMRQGSKGVNPGPNPALGPGSLRRQTGRLARSLRGAAEARVGGKQEQVLEITQRRSTVRMVFGSKVPYARAHEQGLNTQVQVGAHTRTQTQAFGNPLNPPQQVQVSAHSRRMDIPPRPYLGPALNAQIDEVKKKVERGLADAFDES